MEVLFGHIYNIIYSTYNSKNRLFEKNSSHKYGLKKNKLKKICFCRLNMSWALPLEWNSHTAVTLINKNKLILRSLSVKTKSNTAAINIIYSVSNFETCARHCWRAGLRVRSGGRGRVATDENKMEVCSDRCWRKGGKSMSEDLFDQDAVKSEVFWLRGRPER